MARYPGATWKPLAADWAAQPRMRAFDIICIHTMVGGLEGTDTQFRVTNGPGFVGTESHFGTSWDGRVIQWQDTAYQAEANYNGNGHIISIENADWGAPFPQWSGSDVPAFTAQQIEAIAQIVAWACRTHSIPCVLIPDSKPGRRGIAPHRWGVPGYMVAGGEQWSTSQGKACPGDRRIGQLPQIISRAQQLLSGAPQEDTVSMDDVVHSWYDPRFRENRNYAQVIHNIEDQATAANTQLAGLTAAVSTLATAVAGGRDDLTAEELTAAVDEGIRRGGAAILAAQEAARAADPTS